MKGCRLSHRDDGKRFVVHAGEELTAFIELELAIRPDQRRTSLSYETGLSNSICAARQPRHGQAAARWNRRAATPNAIRVSVINDRVDPVSGTVEDTSAHVPGALALCPIADVPLRCPVSPGDRLPPPTVVMEPLRAPALTCQTVIAPVGPVAKLKLEKLALIFVMVCTPSESVKAVGVTLVNGMFGARGPANVTIADTKSLVV